MASVTFTDSYYVSGLGDTSFGIRVNYTEQSYNISTNKTTIHVSSVEIMCSRTVSGPVYGTLKIGNSTIVTFSGGYTHTASPSAGSYDTISGFSGANIDISHNDVGAASMTVSLTGGSSGVFGLSYNGKMFGVRTSTNKSVSLTTHPRASTISSCPAAANTQDAITIGVTRNSSSYYHKATFKVGGTTLHTSDAFATSLSYTIPRSWFTSYSSVSSLTVTVSVQTYTSSACTTTVGNAATKTMTVTADADMKPVVSAGWATLAPYNTGAVSAITGYVKGYSQAEATFDSTKISMTDAVGASIASYSVTCQGNTVNTSPYRTGVLSAVSVEVLCTVTDTRGRTASESFTIAVMDYATPTMTGQVVFRCDSLGVEDEDGTYLSVKATANISSLDGQNTYTLTAAFKSAGGSYGAETSLISGTASLLFPVSADISYTVRLTLTDSLGNTAIYYANVPTRKWAMKFRPDGNGVAFGKAAETNALFEITADWDVKFGGKLYPDGGIDGIGDVASEDILPVAKGGTGADNAADARTNLGIQLLPTVIVDNTYSTASTATFDKTYTVSGSGVIVVFASVLSDSTSDYGTWRAHIFHNGNRIFGEGTRWGENLPYSLGASTAVPISVSNGDTIEVYLSHTKGGRKDAYRRFLCFGGCSVS